MKFDNRPTSKELRDFFTVLSLGISVILTIGLGALIGYALDKLFNTNYFVIIGISLFTVIAMINFIRNLMRLK